KWNIFFILAPLIFIQLRGISSLSLHDALPISRGGGDLDDGDEEESEQRHRQRHSQLDPDRCPAHAFPLTPPERPRRLPLLPSIRDRKSTRLNSSHVKISYAASCLKKKKFNFVV